MAYSEKVMDHFQHPRNVGEIENASGVGTVGNAKCGDIMRIFLDIDDETHIIKDCKFKTFGCGAAVATSSMATEMVMGKTIEEAMEVTNKAVMEALDGLLPVKVHCSLLAEAAIHAALWDYAQKHHIEIKGLKTPKSDIHEGEEAEEEAIRMLNVYGEFAEKYMAVPVVKGVKSANERFAGALDTYTIEAMMQDGKALQSGTSHFLGQNFAKAFDVQFVNKENKMEYVWATSWGVSTRLMGALIMTHSDDNGLVLPPHLAPIQVVIVPIYKNDEQLKQIDAKVEGIVAKLKALGISVKYDNADNKRPGFKFADYELKGVPVRLVMGGRDLENNTMEVMRRDTLEKETVTCDGIETYVQKLLEEIQANIYKKALDYRNSKITTVDTYEEFKEKIEEGGFILAHWDGTTETEEKIKEDTKATIRCIPFDSYVEGDKEPGKCMVTGKPSACRVVFARSY